MDSLATSVEDMTKTIYKQRTIPPEYSPRDRVWLSSKNISLKMPVVKFVPHFLGSFWIIKYINLVIYKLSLPPSPKKRQHQWQLSFMVFLFHMCPSTIPTSVFHLVGKFWTCFMFVFSNCLFLTGFHSPLYLLLFLRRRILPKEEFKVKEMLDVNKIKGKLYLVDWKGYSTEERYWEPQENINAPGLIKKIIVYEEEEAWGGIVMCNDTAVNSSDSACPNVTYLTQIYTMECGYLKNPQTTGKCWWHIKCYGTDHYR